MPGDPANIAGLSMTPGNAFNKNLDPYQFGRGVLAHGMVDIDGVDMKSFVTVPGGISKSLNYDATKVYDETTTTTTSKTVNGVTTTTTTTLPMKGAAFIDVNTADINNWKVGDRLVIAGTDPNAVNPATGKSSDEEGLVKEIADLGSGRSRIYFRLSVTTGVDPKIPLKPTVDEGGNVSTPL